MTGADKPSHSPGNDNATAAQAGGFPADVIMALRFFSRLPTGHAPHEKPDLSRIAMAMPFASLIIGGGPAVLMFVLTISGFSPLFAAFVAAATAALVGGAMSEDAIADSADGLFGGQSPERRLDILKDSRHGTYGVLAIVFTIGLKATALATIAAVNPLAALLVWLAAIVLARSGGLYLALALPAARTDGASADAGRLARNGFIVGLVFAVIIALVLAAPFVGLVGFGLAIALAIIVILGWTRLCDRLLGGQTGDLIGGLQALLEIAVLGTFMRMITG